MGSSMERNTLDSAVTTFWDTLVHSDILQDAVVYLDDAVQATLSWTRPHLVEELLCPAATNSDSPCISVASVKSLLDEVERIITSPAVDSIQPFAVTDTDSAVKLHVPEPPTVIFLLAQDLFAYQSELQVILSHHRYSRCRIYTGVPEPFQRTFAASRVETWDDFANSPVSDRSSTDDGPLEDPSVTRRGQFDWLSKVLTTWTATQINEMDPALPASYQVTADIQYAPLVYASLAPDLFTLPSCANVFPTLTPKESTGVSGSAPQPLLSRMALIMASLFEGVNIQPDYYTLGPFAYQIVDTIHRTVTNGSTTTDFPKSSVIVIDRTLDLVAPCMQVDHLVDQIYQFLPPFIVSLDDRRVEPKLGPNSKTSAPTDYRKSSLPFSLATALSRHWVPPAIYPTHYTLEQLLPLTQREALNLIRKRLSDTVAQSSLKVKLPKALGKVTAPQLKKVLDSCLEHPTLWQQCPTPLITALATYQTLEASALVNRDELVGIEKVLMLTTNEGGEDESALLARVLDMLPDVSHFPQKWIPNHSPPIEASKRPRDTNTYDFTTLLTLLILTYSLVGQFRPVPEEYSQMLMVHEQAYQTRLLECFDRWLTSQAGDNTTAQTLTQCRAEFARKVEVILRHLRNVSGQRRGLKYFRQLHQTQAANPYVPLVSQVIDALAQVWEPEISTGSPSQSGMAHQVDQILADVRHYEPTSQLTSYISSFSRLMKSRSSHPFRNPGTVYLMVVGGMTFWEMQQLRQKLAAHPHAPPVVVVTTAMTCNENIVHNVFGFRDL